MILTGLLCLLYNMWMTARTEGPAVEEDYLVALAAD